MVYMMGGTKVVIIRARLIMHVPGYFYSRRAEGVHVAII